MALSCWRDNIKSCGASFFKDEKKILYVGYDIVMTSTYNEDFCRDFPRYKPLFEEYKKTELPTIRWKVIPLTSSMYDVVLGKRSYGMNGETVDFPSKKLNGAYSAWGFADTISGCNNNHFCMICTNKIELNGKNFIINEIGDKWTHACIEPGCVCSDGQDHLPNKYYGFDGSVKPVFDAPIVSYRLTEGTGEVLTTQNMEIKYNGEECFGVKNVVLTNPVPSSSISNTNSVLAPMSIPILLKQTSVPIPEIIILDPVRSVNERNLTFFGRAEKLRAIFRKIPNEPITNWYKWVQENLGPKEKNK